MLFYASAFASAVYQALKFLSLPLGFTEENIPDSFPYKNKFPFSFSHNALCISLLSYLIYYFIFVSIIPYRWFSYLKL